MGYVDMKKATCMMLRTFMLVDMGERSLQKGGKNHGSRNTTKRAPAHYR
jgi:hypothetical protein